jgi:hypothetical protein
LSTTAVVAPSSLPAGFNGAFYPQTVQSSGAFTGTFVLNGTTGDVTVTNPGPVGDYTITISSNTSCGSPTTNFVMKVIGPPASVAATGGTPQSAPVNTAFAPVSATVTDAAAHPLNNVAVNFTAPASGASATFPSGGSAVTNASAGVLVKAKDAVNVATILPGANGSTEVGVLAVATTRCGGRDHVDDRRVRFGIAHRQLGRGQYSLSVQGSRDRA